MHVKCLFCGNAVELILVHGHYQCPCCKTNALPCCDGDNCDNLFLNEPPASNKNPVSQTDSTKKNISIIRGNSSAEK